MLRSKSSKTLFMVLLIGLLVMEIAFWVYKANQDTNDIAYEGLPFLYDKVEYEFRGKSLSLWVADTDEKRKQGLMYYQELGDNEGMLFVFDTPSEQCMWMKNTPIELGVVFLDEDQQVLAAHVMAPHDLTTHCSNGPAKWAIEANPSSLGLVSTAR